MVALTTIVVVGALAWGATRLPRIARAMGSAAGRAATPAWPGAAAPPASMPFVADEPPAAVPVSTPRVQPVVRRPAEAPAPPRGLAAVTQAQAAAPAPRGRYPLSSQSQRRRPDRSARLYARARGPGLCSPRTDP